MSRGAGRAAAGAELRTGVASPAGGGGPAASREGGGETFLWHSSMNPRVGVRSRLMARGVSASP